MNINYLPDICPRCGTHFRDYYDTLKENFESEHAADLARVRSKARYKGVGKGIILGLLLSTSILLLLRNDSELIGYWEDMYTLYSHHPYSVAVVYFVGILIFTLIEGGNVDTSTEQKMWEQFL